MAHSTYLARRGARARVFIFVHICIYLCVCLHIRTCLCICLCLCLCICAYLCVFMYAFMFVCVCVCVMLGVFLPPRINVWIYLYFSLSAVPIVLELVCSVFFFRSIHVFPSWWEQSRLSASCYETMIGLVVCTTFDYSSLSIWLHKKVHTLDGRFW